MPILPQNARSQESGRSGIGRIGLAWVAIYGQLLLAWAAVWAMDPARTVPEGLVGGLSAWQELCRTSAADASLTGLWAMWAVMGAAMMLPTALPALRDFASLTRLAALRGEEPRPGLSFLALVLGYLSVWAGFALAAAGAQAVLSQAELLDLRGASVSPALTAALLVAAGAYQFSPLKDACLSRCRSPMTGFLATWRPGPASAAATGFRLGLDCLGCCWALMALAFVGGMSNLLWMGGATFMMALEKLPTLGKPLTRPLGIGLIGAGALIAAEALFKAS